MSANENLCIGQIFTNLKRKAKRPPVIVRQRRSIIGDFTILYAVHFFDLFIVALLGLASVKVPSYTSNLWKENGRPMFPYEAKQFGSIIFLSGLGVYIWGTSFIRTYAGVDPQTPAIVGRTLIVLAGCWMIHLSAHSDKMEFHRLDFN